MKKKVYAIKQGFDFENNKKVENVIVNTWAECLRYVKGVKGAKYKSFEDIDEANNFLNTGSGMLKKEEDNYPKDCLHVYVDGSYNISSMEYSYGFVAVKDNIVCHIEGGKGLNSHQNNIRQIAGELKAAVRGVTYALDAGEKRVVIFHDYEGVSHHATGFWQRREESSKEYYEEMNALMKKGIEVIFVKVDSHTGDFFNELADEVCKEKLGITSERVVEKWLCNHQLKVKSEFIKKYILKVAPNSYDNILVESKHCDDENIIFKNIIEKYKNDNLITKDLILNLNEQEKNNFILYLLENHIKI